MSRNQEYLTCRKILIIMLILCFMLQHTLRYNMSIAIVDMIDMNSSDPIFHKSVRHFNWNQDEKNNILGCFYWGYLATSIPGGRIAEIVGTRKVLGIGMFVASVFTILIPTACHFNYYCVILVRICLGLALGVGWPSVLPMAAVWVGPNNRSTFISHTAAASMGVAISLPLCGFLIKYLGWPSVFYVTGGVTLLWTFAWFYLVYDTPSQHPRISKEEKEALQEEVMPENNSVRKTNVPWKQILTSGPVWAIIVANVCFLFEFYIILNQLPTYMHDVLHFKITDNGLLSSLPHFARYAAAVGLGYSADKLIKSKKFSTIYVRRLLTTVTFCVPGSMFIIQSWWGYDPIVSVVVFTFSLGALGSIAPGFFANCVDIAPNYSGTIFGLANAIGATTGYGTTKLVATLTRKKQNFEEWMYIFCILVAVNLFGWIFYLIFSSGKPQTWNFANTEEVENLNQLQAQS